MFPQPVGEIHLAMDWTTASNASGNFCGSALSRCTAAAGSGGFQNSTVAAVVEVL